MIDANNIPKHIAIIMDGNGRWAKARGLPRTAGHRVGIERVREVTRAADDFGIKFITLFAFSAENWSRPPKEVGVLLRYLNNFLDKQAKELDENNMRMLVIGRSEPIPEKTLEKIKKAQEMTQANTGLTLVLALNYGSRQEIVDAAKRFAQAAVKGDCRADVLDPEAFSRYFYTAGIPDPDLLIRTSGEMRLSNFLLWQLSYAELYFAKKNWPDFKREDLERALIAYQKRERRFGGIPYAGKTNI